MENQNLTKDKVELQHIIVKMSQKFPGQCIHVKLHLSIYSFQKNSWGGGGGGVGHATGTS